MPSASQARAGPDAFWTVAGAAPAELVSDQAKAGQVQRVAADRLRCLGEGMSLVNSMTLGERQELNG